VALAESFAYRLKSIDSLNSIRLTISKLATLAISVFDNIIRPGPVSTELSAYDVMHATRLGMRGVMHAMRKLTDEIE
jgi:hypothetical protein